MSKPHRQVLLRPNRDDESWLIRRGDDGVGYYLEGTDVINGRVLRTCLPVDQEFVASAFKEQGLEWRTEK